MKQRFQILNDPRFHLVYGVTQRFSYGPSPKPVSYTHLTLPTVA